MFAVYQKKLEIRGENNYSCNPILSILILGPATHMEVHYVKKNQFNALAFQFWAVFVVPEP